MLPAQKVGFPKCLYLDQNHWIALARSANGLDQSRFLKAFRAVKRAIALRRLVVPLSNVHILETLAPGNRDRRHRLAEIMSDLSENCAIRPSRTVQEAEISLAVASTLGIFLPYPIRPHIVVKGLTHALGEIEIFGDPTEVVKAKAHLLSGEHTLCLLTEETNRAVSAFLREQETNHAADQNRRTAEALAEVPEEGLLQIDVFSLISRHEVTERISKTLGLLRVAPTAMNEHLSSFDQHLRFLRRVPTLNVRLNLWQQRYKNPDRKTHRNDWKDIGFLSVAIPYANIVVTEKYWSHVSNQTGLASKYETIVTASIEHLPELLESQGCF
jgi:hypothetical protein